MPRDFCIGKRINDNNGQSFKKTGKNISNYTTVDIFKWIKERNQLAEEALNITPSHLGIALAGVMNAIDVEEIIIGGGLSEAGETLIEPLKKLVEIHLFPQIRANCTIKKAVLGNDAGVYGAAYNIWLNQML